MDNPEKLATQTQDGRYYMNPLTNNWM